MANNILLWQPGSENQADIDPIMQKLANLLPEHQAIKRNKDFIRSQSIRAKKSRLCHNKYIMPQSSTFIIPKSRFNH